MLDNPFFGIGLTFLAYYIGIKVREKISHTLANPLLIALVLISVFLLVTGISYDTYMAGADYILIFMGPATVSLVVPLYKNIETLKSNLVPILVGITVGAITAIVSIIVLSNILGLDRTLTISLVPKSVTTAIAIPLSDALGGLGVLTAVFVAFRGVVGAVLGPAALRLAGITDPVAKGIALGTSSHAFGTAKALEMGELEGSMSGLSIAIAGIVTAIVAPFIVSNFI